MKTRQFNSNAAHAEGVVIAVPAGSSHPLIQFDTKDGQQVLSPQGGFIFGYRPDDKVKVLYDASSPSAGAKLDALGSAWFSSLFLAGLGAFFLAVLALNSLGE